MLLQRQVRSRFLRRARKEDNQVGWIAEPFVPGRDLRDVYDGVHDDSSAKVGRLRLLQRRWSYNMAGWKWTLTNYERDLCPWQHKRLNMSYERIGHH